MRDAAGRAKVAAPVAADDIARKAETDAEAKARLQAINNEARERAEGDNATLESLASHADNKGNPHGVTAAQVGLGNVDNTPDNEKSVKYAQTAGSAKADGGNADTVGGFNAGNGVNMLVPVVAFNVGENAGYIKLGNGLIVQWGKKFANKMQIDFPLEFSKCLYFNFIVSRTSSTDDGWHYYNNLTTRGVTVLSLYETGMWIAIGI